MSITSPIARLFGFAGLVELIVLGGFVGLVSTSQVAHAQSSAGGRDDPFFADKVVDEAESSPDTVVQGSVTLTTFGHQEFGGDDAIQGDDPSPVSRVFSDLRTQLTAKDIAGSPWQARLDARVRATLPCDFTSLQVGTRDDLDDYGACRTQSGSFGENEYELRELYGTYAGDSLNIQVGRQFVPEVAALKVDGARVQYSLNKEWSLLAMGGLYPSKISRSVLEDYPGLISTGAAMQSDGPVLPVAAGAGGSYRYERYYGSVAAGGILPMSNDVATGAAETPRTFVTSNGYWRPVSLVDVYHFAVVDITGAAGTGLTNGSLGVNFKPANNLRVTAAYNQVDTDTLNAIAQNRLESPDADTAILQNNIEVSRISSRSARLGVSAALAERRFEVSTHLQARFRPQLVLCPSTNLGCAAGDAGAIVFPGAHQAEVMLGFVDRQSFGGLRLGANVVTSFGLGSLLDAGDGETTPDNNHRRSQVLTAQVNGSRSLLDEQLQLEGTVGYQYSQDIGGERDGGEQRCATPINCFGNATINTVTIGATAYWRFLRDWFVVFNANGGYQLFVTTDVEEPQTNILVNGFLRAAYRF